MAQLIVRNIEDDVKERLVQRARRHGRSMEEEVRDILRQAVRSDRKAAPETGLGTRLANFFEAHGFDELEIDELKGREARPATFD
jgi:plasmid stability protein